MQNEALSALLQYKEDVVGATVNVTVSYLVFIILFNLIHINNAK